MKNLLVIIAFITLFVAGSQAQSRIAAKNASKYMGQTVLVYDKVFKTEIIKATNTTILYLGAEDGKYLTVFVKGANSKFKWHPEADFQGRTVIVSGQVTTKNGKPALMADNPGQLRLDLTDNKTPVPMNRP
jgi:hypothetical protein